MQVQEKDYASGSGNLWKERKEMDINTFPCLCFLFCLLPFMEYVSFATVTHDPAFFLSGKFCGISLK